KLLQNNGVAIAGAGRMGRGIATAFISRGYPVFLIDIKERSEEEFENLVTISLNEIRQQVHILKEVNIIAENPEKLMQLISITHIDDTSSGWEHAPVLFEAVPETLEIKENTFQKINNKISPNALIGSTTSSFLSNELAKYVEHPERFLNTHWLNPAYLMPLIEVSPSEKTSEACLKQFFQLFESINKVPVECSSSPGYIVPRIQALAMNEGAKMVDEGVATAESLDKAIKTGFGPRFTMLGLLEFIDWGGADTLYYASHSMADALQNNRYNPP